MTVHHVAQQHDNSDRGEQRLPRIDWSPGESRDYSGHDSERGQQDDVDLRMTKEPPDMVTKDRTTGRGSKEGGPEKPISLEHYQASVERTERPKKLANCPESENRK